MVLLLTTAANSQATVAKVKEPMSNGRTLSEWIADLRDWLRRPGMPPPMRSPSMGPRGGPAVPALIEALDDPSPVVRFPVTVALGEIGPGPRPRCPACSNGRGGDQRRDRGVGPAGPEAHRSGRRSLPD